MAKGQKKSNRETRKPKQAKAKPAAGSDKNLGNWSLSALSGKRAPK